ncbi:MAG: ADP-ribosylation factor-like protein [Promethearchaeota archaeon]
MLRIEFIYELLDFKHNNLYNYISSDFLKSLEKKGISVQNFENKIQKAISIASILNQLREKSLKIEKGQQKIIVAGLDKAGKTAILSTFGGKLGLNELANLSPTKKVERRKIETKELSLFIWDFGGQSKYREDYLKSPGTYFIGVDLLIYVIDVQDYERFDESFTYLKAILNALELLEEAPHVLIFIHKHDPDLKNDPDIQLNVEFIKENLTDILKDIKFSYEIYLTSIYSVISREPEFSKYIKEMITEQRDLVSDSTKDKIESLGDIVKSALNAIIKLSESTAKQYKDIDLRFQLLERNLYVLKNAIQGGTVIKQQAPQPQQSQSVLNMLLTPQGNSLHPPPNLHPPPSPGSHPVEGQPVAQSQTTIRMNQTNIRASIMDELKALFSKTKDLNR